MNYHRTAQHSDTTPRFKRPGFRRPESIHTRPSYWRLSRQKHPDIKHKRFVRIWVGKQWRYYKNFNNALRYQSQEFYEWLCVNEPGFNPMEVLQALDMKPERLGK